MFSPQTNQKYHYRYSLYTNTGERKYLDESERTRFIDCALQQQDAAGLLGLVLVLSGCRLTEALNLSPSDILEEEGAIVVRSLKKRQKHEFRQIPLPPGTIAELLKLGRSNSEPLFPWQRTQALQHVKKHMRAVGISGVKATARGLRHTFGTHGIRVGIPLTLLQRWFGHASIETTAIYTQILGPEEREIAKKMW